ncbi:MAG: hypothetical protein RIC14_00980 [Filomicrobium sp.]
MIGHVASTHEGSGRVVLCLRAGRPASDAAFDAAARIAKAFQSDIEGLFVEERQLLDLTAYGFVKETSLSGGITRPISTPDIERQFEAACRAMHQRLKEIGGRLETRVLASTVRSDPVPALAQTCAAAGPWNVIVRGEAFQPQDGLALGEILASVRDCTGLVTVGPKAGQREGRIVAAIEDPERMTGLVRTAERLAAGEPESAAGVTALLIGDDHQHLQWLDEQARLAFPAGQVPRIVAAPPTRGEPGVAAEAIRQLGPGFVVAQYGGVTVPYDDLSALTVGLECPLFLVR